MKENLPTSSKIIVGSVLGLQLFVVVPLFALMLYVTWSLSKVLFYMLRPLINLLF
ncbi:MAG: hypothetical protein ACK4FF_05440 [Limnobacter sp.]|uniref:hypothetical protein n=1 Tax=Limnobacter sp. TaxID=2003368 RepID=UPI00391B9895